MSIQTPSYPPPPAPQRSRTALLLITGIVLLVAAAAGTTAALGIVGGSGSRPTAGAIAATFTMTGFLHVMGSPFTEFTVDGSGGCTPTGGYGDINEGTAVVVADGAGRTLTTGQLEAGRTQTGACVMPIVVAGVPDHLPQYVITISHRGSRVVTPTEAHQGLELSLGDN
jgi:hypothetical protein